MYFSVYLIDHILPLGKRTWGWPLPAEPLPDALNTSWEERGHHKSDYRFEHKHCKHVSSWLQKTSGHKGLFTPTVEQNYRQVNGKTHRLPSAGVITCMNCGLNVLFVESWGQTCLLHHHHHCRPHLDCPGSPLNRILFCFLKAAAKAKDSDDEEHRQKKSRWP